MQEKNQVVLTISEINRLARLALEKQLPSCWVRGELSNLTRAASGHWYFTIKDATASARCVMFRTRNQFVEWPVREGAQIEVRAQASLYEARGDFQLVVEAMRQAGQGSLYEAFLRLKERLQQEGLFDIDRKKPLPAMPRSIGIITSPTAAALRDVLTTLNRRWPYAVAILYPCQVQGEAAPGHIQQALREASLRAEVDVLLLVRGGGSLEDLWPFNDEGVARAVAASAIPVISGVGHETDFTITDFVADARAPTPTGAAQLSTPDSRELIRRIHALGQGLTHRIRVLVDGAWQHHDHLQKRLRHPRESLRLQRSQVRQWRQRLIQAARQRLDMTQTRMGFLSRRLTGARPAPEAEAEHLYELKRRLHQHQALQHMLRARQLAHLRTQLELLCPSQVLQRGYSIVRSPQGTIIKSSEQVGIEDRLSVELAHGRLVVAVKDRRP